MQPREFDFLCCAIAPRPNLDRAEELIKLGINWQTLTDLAAAHAVRPQLLRVLRASFWDDIPQNARQRMEIFRHYQVARNLHIAKELTIITDALVQSGIRYAIFKGIALAILLYRNIFGREFNDIDLIVDERDVAAAEQVIEANGYAAKYGNAEFRAAFLSYQRQYIFVDYGSNLAIDLHWDFIETGDPFPLQTSKIWDRLEYISVADRDVATLGREEIAIFLAAHGSKHGWASLLSVTDFAVFFVNHPGLDWCALYHRARSAGCGRCILLATSLASALMQVDIGPDLTKLAARDPLLQAAINKLTRRLGEDIAALEPRLWSELCERWPQRVRATWNLLSNRTTGDYEAMPLPRPLWSFYRVTRPFRLSINAIRSHKKTSI